MPKVAVKHYRLFIAESTVQLIIAQRDRVVARYPGTPLSQLRLFPRERRNVHGTLPVYSGRLSCAVRGWRDGLPELIGAAGEEFPRERVFPYAFRHSFAQRHADHGTPLDVLAAMMGHRTTDTTRGYYKVNKSRMRKAVARVSEMQLNHAGNRVSTSFASLVDADYDRYRVGQIAVAFGTCHEPSNVKSSGQSCPYRYRCFGCTHFRTDPSYLSQLREHLQRLLADHERLNAVTDGMLEDWARRDARLSSCVAATAARSLHLRRLPPSTMALWLAGAGTIWDASWMDGFDAEQYLRLAGQELLLGAEPEPSLSTLAQAAGALVAAGLIDGDVGQRVLDEYGDAIAVRARREPHTGLRAARARLSQCPRQVSPVRELRMVRCDHLIEREQWTLRIRQVHLAADETTLLCDFRSRPGAAVLTNRDGRPLPGLVAIPVVDDRGTETAGWFTNRSSGSSCRGERELRGVLATDSSWIEVDGERCDLVDERPTISVTVGPADEQDPALRHLWRQVAIHSHYGDAPIELRYAIDALTAAGAVSAHDVARVLAVHKLLTAVQQGHDPPRDHDLLPEPWRSMLARRGRDDGPLATILASTTVPPIDGISVAIRTVESRRTEFVVDVECKPSLGLMTLYDWDSRERLAWWAADDRGNRYLGQTRKWVSHDHEGREDDSHGKITFWPSLDPAASSLDIIPTAETTQAVISIPLSGTTPNSSQAEASTG